MLLAHTSSGRQIPERESEKKGAKNKRGVATTNNSLMSIEFGTVLKCLHKC